MHIIVSNASIDPIYEQIISQIKTQIMGGTVQEGDALPSIRNLAKELRISVTTTKRAYEDLEREGFIDTVAGKGCFVAFQNKAFIREQKMRLIEDKLNEAIEEARMIGLSLDEMKAMLDLLYEEEK